ncbi:MAG: ATP-binding protein, partial [Chitinophagaceae bacterium]|nr:ATP-binding protein [Chitinophagaceae bacterium]
MNPSTNLIISFQFLQEVIRRRLQIFFGKEGNEIFSMPEIKLENEKTPLSEFLLKHQLSLEEYIILLLAMTTHVQPNLIDNITQQFLPNGGEFPEIGGVKGTNHRATIPTGETALFIIAGNDLSRRMQVMHYFSADHFFVKENVLNLESVKEGEPRMSGKLILQPEWVDLFTTGNVNAPTFGPEFPAKSIRTNMEWTDLVLNDKTAESINDISLWLNHNEEFLKEWGMEKKIKPGYRALFYGPSGTGKTLTATLLGKQFQKEVYRIDLSQVVSKYIGETEKNLEKIFSKAENKDWILFFDEADALFGKRSNVQSAHDKYANQEVSYLLQRVEDFPGLVILASNNKSNIDSAFIRRFNAIIHFPFPSPQERERIWRVAFPPKGSLDDQLDLQSLATKYELSGSAIVSVLHYASLQTIYR